MLRNWERCANNPREEAVAIAFENLLLEAKKKLGLDEDEVGESMELEEIEVTSNTEKIPGAPNQATEKWPSPIKRMGNSEAQTDKENAHPNVIAMKAL